jgi:dipeptidyl aminopeptidase/acylaminoacyl peptidase
MRTQLLVAVFLGCQLAAAQQPNTQQPTAQPDFRPLVAIQEEDYAKARQHFQTTLLRSGPAPQKWSPVSPPAGVIEVEYPSGPLKLKAWVNQPDSSKKKYPAVLFLHGGHSFSIGDWEMSQPYRDAGFVVLTPLLRGENGQPGNFTMYYDEVADVLAAADYLRRLPYIDPSRVFVAGHSVGGTMTMLAALSYEHFRGAASLSGSPDQVLYVKYAPGAKDRAPFDYTNARELEMRSPLAFAAFFKCPLRIYYGSQEPQFELTSQRTAQIAMDRGMDVEVVRVEGNHMSHVPESVKASA